MAHPKPSQIFTFTFPLLLTLNSCATSTSSMEQFRALEGDAKIAYLDAYPDLSPEQKTDFLANRGSLRQLMSANNTANNTLNDTKAAIPRPIRKPLSLQMEPLFSAPITEGNTIDFKAYVNYSDGRKVESTSDVTWQALPSLVKVHTNQLHYECVYSDISISASFFDEVKTTQVIAFKKPLDTIGVQVAESSSIIDNSAFIKLNSRAICKDGTVTEISCQSVWKADPEWGRFFNCGQLQPSAKSWLEGAAIVTVSYGPITVTRKIFLPARTPQR